MNFNANIIDIFCAFLDIETFRFVNIIDKRIKETYKNRVKTSIHPIYGSFLAMFSEKIFTVNHGKTVRKFFIGRINSITNYSLGLRNGKCIEYYPNGEVKKIENYKNDLLHGETKEFFSDGNMNFSCNYKKGRKDGLQTILIESANMKKETYYKNNKKNGEEKVYNYNLNSQTFVSSETKIYKNNILNGESKVYHPNGNVYIVEEYSNGKLTGFRKEYDTEGKLIKINSVNKRVRKRRRF